MTPNDMERLRQLLVLRKRAAEAKLGAMRRDIEQARASAADLRQASARPDVPQSASEAIHLAHWQNQNERRARAEEADAETLSVDAAALARVVARHLGEEDAWDEMCRRAHLQTKRDTERRAEDLAADAYSSRGGSIDPSSPGTE